MQRIQRPARVFCAGHLDSAASGLFHQLYHLRVGVLDAASDVYDFSVAGLRCSETAGIEDIFEIHVVATRPGRELHGLARSGALQRCGNQPGIAFLFTINSEEPKFDAVERMLPCELAEQDRGRCFGSASCGHGIDGAVFRQRLAASRVDGRTAQEDEFGLGLQSCLERGLHAEYGVGCVVPPGLRIRRVVCAMHGTVKDDIGLEIRNALDEAAGILGEVACNEVEVLGQVAESPKVRGRSDYGANRLPLIETSRYQAGSDESGGACDNDSKPYPQPMYCGRSEMRRGGTRAKTRGR